jgi:hypothetical protein
MRTGIGAVKGRAAGLRCAYGHCPSGILVPAQELAGEGHAQREKQQRAAR